MVKLLCKARMQSKTPEDGLVCPAHPWACFCEIIDFPWYAAAAPLEFQFSHFPPKASSDVPKDIEVSAEHHSCPKLRCDPLGALGPSAGTLRSHQPANPIFKN